MKKFTIILILIFFNKTILASTLFDTSFFEMEFNSSQIENTKIEKINEIKKLSFINILKKTLLKKNFYNVNQNLTDNLINTFVKNIIINDEKIVNNKYYSKIKVNFHKNIIIDYFRENNIPYIEYLPENILIIINEKDNLNTNLFSLNNNFYKYFIESLSSHPLFTIPDLDINDRYTLKIDDLINKNAKKIKKFSIKYNTNDIIIIFANVDGDKVNYNLILYSNGQFIEKKLLFNEYNFDIFYKHLEEETLQMWKSLNQIQNNYLNNINCNISYYNLLELKEIRNKLSNISIIDNLSINELKFKNIKYNIRYYGNLKIFKKILQANQLKINFLDNSCKISLK